VLAIIWLSAYFLIMVFGIGTSIFIRWLYPSIDTGLSLLTGVIVAIASSHFAARIFSGGNEVLNENDSEDADDNLSKRPIIIAPEYLPELMRARQTRRKRNPKTKPKGE
jgi:hypothetical protein